MAMPQVSPSLVPQHPPPSQPPMMDGGWLTGFIALKPRSWFYRQLPSVERMRKMLYTSRIAQGDGRSFKNRKAIGELGCCESRMAERSY